MQISFDTYFLGLSIYVKLTYIYVYYGYITLGQERWLSDLTLGQGNMNDEMKICPFCDEMNSDDLILCNKKRCANGKVNIEGFVVTITKRSRLSLVP